jgi:DNA helicase-2/ATP-dependent DNA helicase PcrA
MHKILEGLNKEQIEAVTYTSGPLLIIAGAGTGKTTAITRRIAWLLSEGLAKTGEILALTFTDKAAGEMQERVDILVPYGYTDIWISTFHAFGDRLLRENALVAGLNPDFKVLTRPEAAVFFREHLFEFVLSYYRPLSDPTRFIEALISLFSRAKDEDVSPQEYLNYAQELVAKAEQDPQNLSLKEEARQQMEVACAYDRYQELLAKEGLVDFGNQFYLALRLLREHPLILKKYQEQFKYILVDEFQDTNFAQYQLAKILAGGLQNITVTGDDDQCVLRGSLISAPGGNKKIEAVRSGDFIFTAVGKGHIGTSRVKRVFKKKKNARLMTFETERGFRVTVTSNHKMFCHVPVWAGDKKTGFYYVYLMWRKGLGWRLGVTNHLAARLKLERSADKIIGLRAFKTEREAQYYETRLSLKYGIPTVCFMKRKGIYIADEWLKKLYLELDTEKRVRQLAADLDIDLDYHHFCLGAVARGKKNRIKINLCFCYRKHVSKGRVGKVLINPSIMHQVSLETSDKETIDKLRKAGFNLAKAKKGFRLRYELADIKKTEDIALKLKELTGGILEYKFNLGKRNIVTLPALVMPASNVLLGHYLPVTSDNSVIYDKVINIKEEIAVKTVYDLEVERTHNFIANGIIVHNCIYRFRGAAYSNLLNFINDFPDAKEISIVRNYRSSQVILDSAYRLIQNNNPERFEVKANIDKRLIGLTKEGSPVQHLHFDTNSTEADNVAKIIKDRIGTGNFKYRDFAILVRSNSDAQSFLQALNMQDMPWQFSGNQGLYSREEVKLCINFLRVVANPSDSLSLYYLVSSEVYSLDLSDLGLCAHYAKRRNKALYLVFGELDNIPELKDISDKSKSKIENILADLKKFLKISREQTTGRLLYSFLTETGFLKRLTQNPSLENETKIQNLAKFFNIVRDFELVAQEDRVMSFVNYLNLLIEAGDDPPTVEADKDYDAVNVLTIHKAKGLEFRVVFLVSLVEGRFPWPHRRQALELPDVLIKEVLPSGDSHIQEERRLFYVGMTRAKEELYLTSAADYGGRRIRRVSQFVLEAQGKEANEFDKKKSSALEAIERFAPKKESPQPKITGTPEGKLISLSYYHMDDYLTCPLKYKYVNILRVPIMEHHTVIYGRAMHESVTKYFQFKMAGKKMSTADLLNAFKESFDPQGFLDEKHQQERFRIGQEALIKFFNEEEKRDSKPLYIEKEFSFILGDNKITGRFDRIDLEEDGAVIMDFKTSEIKTQKEANKRTKESMQLSLYSLAYKNVFGQLPKRVELYFLESGIIGSNQIQDSDLERVKDKISEVSQGIRDKSFIAAPTYMACTYCAYEQICPFAINR